MGRKKQTREYKIRDILDFKEEEGREYLLIWWLGYPKRQATWEPVENISHVYEFNEYYQRLKQNYQNENNHSSNLNQQAEEPQPSQSVPPKSIENGPSKSKPIAKKSKKPKALSDVYHSDSEAVPPSEDKQEQPIIRRQPKQPIYNESDQHDHRNMIEESNPPNPPNPPIDREELKRLIRQAPPAQFEIKIKEFKDLPLVGQRLKAIKDPFKRDGKVMYEIQLDSRGSSEPIFLHEDYIKVLWPQQFAKYLLSKVK